jgi:Putative adhesin
VTDTADTEGRREERIPVDLNQPLVLDVHNPNGDVSVRATERTDVLISHITPGFGGDPGDEEIGIAIDARQNRIEVRVNSGAETGWAGIAGDIDLDTVVGEIDAVVGQITRAFRRGGHRASARSGRARVAVGRHAWTDVTIEVPQAITGRIGVHTASGDVRVEGVTSEIALNTVSGDVRVMRTSGDLVLQTASGDLAIEGASGRLTAQTASGDVNVTSFQTEGFDIHTASGDVLFNAMPTGDGPFRFQTVSGDVRLALRRSTAGGTEPDATLAFHTVSGDAHVTQPFRKTSRRHWQVGSGDRGPRIDVTTVSGDLVAGLAAVKSDFIPSSTPASSAGDVPAAPPAPPAAPAPANVPSQPSSPTAPAPFTMGESRGEDDVAMTDVRPEAAQSPVEEDAVRLAVLEAVERGEIDVEEALRRLEAVDSIPGT